MAQTPSNPMEAAPRWLVVVASAVIVFHLGAVVVRAMAARSGPWPSPIGVMPFTPPWFAYSADRLTGPYLQAVGLADRYHFPSNDPHMPGVYLVFRLKDGSGSDVGTVRLPDPSANFWVRHRQTLLARNLGGDEPLTLPQSEVIAAPNQQVQELVYWQEQPNEWGRLRLARQSVNQFDRNRMYLRPADSALVCARTYARYLCRTNGAEKAEVV